ncbi:methyltransferase domain-containing protein [Streptomyces kaniharaensis]|uniref:Methyltransferase domain-containing protein n=1 Tax=Streptomyces kaniharaensis TaxID=212423 RepID=A0A6N7KWJ5_9ACTN|nr:methyltransferase domain-containing protein [Streptomyces kaniharaensis]MQS14374.1 methyltransferase domain-containing protein [Streptomyces kaniharaensis]
MGAQELDLAGLRRVYGRPGSRLFYTRVARNARHWGWTEPGQSKWRLWRAQRQLEDVLGRKLALPADARVLDAGSGAGVVARAMADRFGLAITGVDVLDFHVAEARRLSTRTGLAQRTSFTWGDYHQLPFPDGTFDGAYSMETLVHSYDPPRALAEFHRVLRPGGRLVLLGPMSTVPLDEMAPRERALLEPYLDAMVMTGAKIYHARNLPQLLTEAGFEVEEALDATPYYLPTTEAVHAYFWLPWAVLRRFGDPARWLNLRSTVEMYDVREYVAWYVHTAVKPQE